MDEDGQTAVVAADVRQRMLAEVQRGLARADKQIPCKFFYDDEGSRLFERICELPEYYLTRTELLLTTSAADEMARALGPGVRMVEFGSGNSRKTQLLLDRLEDAAAYVPIDIARTALQQAVAALRVRYPRLPIESICADYTEPFQLPAASSAVRRTVCYFPGSTIGNFADDEAVRFLRRVAHVCGREGGLLIGADLRKDTAVLLPAYNDSAGVTAEFNRNVLRRIRTELGAEVVPEQFEHRAVWNGEAGRIEMQLISAREQVVRVGGASFPFRSGEILTTEYSHKYTLEGFATLAAAGGFAVEHVWTDPQRWFSVQLLRRR